MKRFGRPTSHRLKRDRWETNHKLFMMKKSKTYLALASIMVFCVVSCDTVNSDENPDGQIQANFEAFTTVTGTFSGQDLAFIGDNSQKQLYLSYKVFEEPATETGPVVINRISTSNGEQTLFSHVPSEFPTASRQLLISGDQLHMVSGRMISTFDFPLVSGVPSIQNVTGTHMSRFGAFIHNNDIYTVGGRTGLEDEPVMSGNTIGRWNVSTGAFEDVATMPAPKFWADAQLMGSKVYVFGGQTAWADIENPQSTIFIYDLNSNAFTTLQLPRPVSWTYTAAYGDKIIVGGLIRTGTDASNADLDIFLGVFDTNTNEFAEISHNLDDSNKNALYDIAVVDDKLYALHGERDVSTLNPVTWTIFAADLDF